MLCEMSHLSSGTEYIPIGFSTAEGYLTILSDGWGFAFNFGYLYSFALLYSYTGFWIMTGFCTLDIGSTRSVL